VSDHEALPMVLYRRRPGRLLVKSFVVICTRCGGVLGETRYRQAAEHLSDIYWRSGVCTARPWGRERPVPRHRVR
jgi:hypothetical protein